MTFQIDDVVLGSNGSWVHGKYSRVSLCASLLSSTDVCFLAIEWLTLNSTSDFSIKMAEQPSFNVNRQISKSAENLEALQAEKEAEDTLSGSWVSFYNFFLVFLYLLEIFFYSFTRNSYYHLLPEIIKRFSSVILLFSICNLNFFRYF